VSEHISSARAALPEQTEAAVREILERLGTPQEIAASAELEGGEPLPPHSRNQTLVVAAVAVVLVVIGVGIAALAGAFTSSTTPSSVGNILAPPSSSSTGAPVGTVAVPTITGQQIAAATQELSAVGLNYIVSYVTSNQPVGMVLVQNPSGGARVDSASRVALTVSGTQAALTVPNVIGQSQAQAEAALMAAGLGVQFVMKPGGSTPPGTVAEESPVAGSRVSPHSIVVLTVS